MEASYDYYVKLDNVIPQNSNRIGFKRITASSGPDLVAKAMIVFNIIAPPRCVQLWSSCLTPHPVRLDHLPVIPAEYEFIWLRIRAY
jgi:hypothetical protein